MTTAARVGRSTESAVAGQPARRPGREVYDLHKRMATLEITRVPFWYGWARATGALLHYTGREMG